MTTTAKGEFTGVGHEATTVSLSGVLSSVPSGMLDCRDVTKRFDDVAVLRGFNVQVQQGQILALLGPSGCGKTTALRAIAGFVQPDSGTIRIGGETVHENGRSVPPEKRRVGMVFQEGALFPHLTVEQNIAYGLSRNDDKPERVNDVVRMTGLGRAFSCWMSLSPTWTRG